MEKQNELFTTPNRAYVDRFVRENYAALSEKFRPMDGKINSHCNSSLDILNDTILTLYKENRIFADYEGFECLAKAKFTEKEKRAENANIQAKKG